MIEVVNVHAQRIRTLRPKASKGDYGRKLSLSDFQIVPSHTHSTSKLTDFHCSYTSNDRVRSKDPSSSGRLSREGSRLRRHLGRIKLAVGSRIVPRRHRGSSDM
ncbi:hypothetical protein PM082_021966 [Marasmius tenuissimus]|nr:hypothetical protein PM082_021966 [Marasmius tenuissimus]